MVEFALLIIEGRRRRRFVNADEEKCYAWRFFVVMRIFHNELCMHAVRIFFVYQSLFIDLHLTNSKISSELSLIFLLTK